MPDFGDINPDTGLPSARSQFEGTVDPYAPSVANGQISQKEWEQYQQRRRWQAAIGVISAILGTAGLGALSGALGGAGAGAAASAGGAGGLAPIAGGAPWAVTPYAVPAIASGTGATAAGAAAAGAGAAGAAGSGAGASAATAAAGAGMSVRDWLALTAAGVGTAGAAFGPKPDDLSPNSLTDDPQLREILDLMKGRIKKAEPLNDSILAMANGLLPTQYQNGGRG